MAPNTAKLPPKKYIWIILIVMLRGSKSGLKISTPSSPRVVNRLGHNKVSNGPRCVSKGRKIGFKKTFSEYFLETLLLVSWVCGAQSSLLDSLEGWKKVK